MKKYLAAIMAVLMILTAFAGLAESAEEPQYSGSVTLYSTMSTEWADPIIAEFEDKYGVTVNVVNAGTSELTARIEAESENVQADVLWGGDSGISQEFADAYLESYVSTEDAAYGDFYKDAENHKWYAQHVEANIAIYNKDLVSEDEVPTTWEELCSEEWYGKIYIPDPTTSGTGANCIRALMYAMSDDDTERYEWLEKFAANLDGIVASGSSVAYKGVIDGEYPIGLTYEEAAYRNIADGANIGVIYMEEGVPLARTSVQMIKGAPNQENAKLLIDYLLSYEVQEYMTTIFRRSARNDIAPTEGMPALDDINFTDPFDPDWISENADKISEAFKEALYQ